VPEKVDLKPSTPAPLVSRPLKTGASFTIVLPRTRAVYRHWDKELYLPGEEAELVLEGEGMGEEAVELTVERAGLSDDDWKPVATVKAKGSGDKASGKFRFPEEEPRGTLVKAEWKRSSATPGDRLGLRVESKGYEGGKLEIVIERQQAGGSWRAWSRLTGAIEQGKYEGIFVVPPGEGEEEGLAGEIVDLYFESEPKEESAAWMVATSEKLEGTQLQFVLERVDLDGAWEEIGSAVSTVKDGLARNSAQVPAAPPVLAGEDPVRLASSVRSGQEEIVVSIDPGWLEGKEFEVKMERRALDGSDWEDEGPVRDSR